MFPDWPESAADLVPLPQIDGPKLSPFDFHGQQRIDFLEPLGEGTHSIVFKVKILGSTYALKVFRFLFDQDWSAPEYYKDIDNPEAFSAFYNYSEPFSCECRAFGRLQESGHEELATRCFGYVLLDELHERNVVENFDIDICGNADGRGHDTLRTRFPGKNGRAPPVRAIVKEFGQGEERLRAQDMRRILRNITQLQQLGIIGIDVADRQIISGKLADFSTAVTTPHYRTNPELNPYLSPAGRSALEFETFKLSMNDYWEFDDMVQTWNQEHEDQKDISVHAFPAGGKGLQSKHNLRSTAARERVWTYVDPRRYDWRSGSAAGQQKARRRLDAKPRRWILEDAGRIPAGFKMTTSLSISLDWIFKNGRMVPVGRATMFKMNQQRWEEPPRQAA